MEPITGNFLATEDAGEVSSLFLRPPHAYWLLALAHGAGAGMCRDSMQRIATCLAVAGIATFRYQIPFLERGGRSRDPEYTTLALPFTQIVA